MNSHVLQQMNKRINDSAFPSPYILSDKEEVELENIILQEESLEIDIEDVGNLDMEENL